MITLHKISNKYAETISKYTAMSESDIRKMISDSDSKMFNGHYFEMYVILSGKAVVGLISLFERSPSVVSIGPEVFDEFRKLGYATEAMLSAMEIAKSIGYRIVLQQVRIDNVASIKLHTKLGFETDNSVFKNRKQNDICIYLKLI